MSPGTVIGRAQIVHWDFPEVTRSVVAPSEVKDEISRLGDALRAVREHLDDLRERTRQRAGQEEAKIFDAQIMMLEDPEHRTAVETLIRENQLSAERAFEFKTLETRVLWSQSSNYILRQRVPDLVGIQVRVLNYLLGQPLSAPVAAPGDGDTLVFTRELTPGLTVQLER